jgi:peroxiredoxin
MENPLEKLKIGDRAPDFSLPNHQGEMVQLSKMLQDKPLLLVFNIGFA